MKYVVLIYGAIAGKPVTSSDGLGNIGLKGRPVSNLRY